VSVPARQRLVEVVLVAVRDVDERGRAGPAVQVLVPAADGQVGAVLVEADVEHSGGVAQVPAGQGADLVGSPGDLREVPQFAGSVVHRRVGGEHQVVADLGDPGHGIRGRDPLDDQPGVARSGIRDVEVGGEGVGIGEHDPAPRAHPRGRDHGLVEVHRGRVGADDLAGCRADEGADDIADPAGCLPPARIVPARDEVVAPLAVHDVGHGLGDTLGQCSQRVAVEVDDPGGKAEPATQVGGGVQDIELAGSLGQR
jgi:hypothetical protein